MLRNLLLVLCLGLTFLCAAPAISQTDAPTPSEEAAIQAFREGSFSRAVELYREALQETDDANHRARLHINIAWTLFALGRESEVQTHLRAALVEDPNLTLLPDYYTQDFIDLFDSARMRSATAEPAAPLPDLESTILSIEARAEAGEDLEGALADLDRLATSYPEDGRIVPLRARLLRSLGRGREADDLLRTYGGAFGPTAYTETMSIPELILRANRLLESNDAGSALELLRQAVARQPNNVAALELMAEAAQSSSHWDEAEFALKSALSLQPGNVGLQLRLGEVYLSENELSAARDIFSKITDDSPHSDRGWAAIGLLEARLGNTERAMHHLDRAITENPLLPEVQLARGELLLAAGKPDDALAALETAANLLHDDPQLEARLGQALLAVDRHEEALERLSSAIDSGFHPPDVERAMALALVLNGRLAEADRALNQLSVAANHDTEIIRGLIELERAENEVAEATFRTVATHRPNEPKILNLLAASLYHQARYKEVVDLLSQAVEIDDETPRIEQNLATAEAARAAELLGENAIRVQPDPNGR